LKRARDHGPRMLERFCEFSGKSPARLLALARTPKGRLEILEILERWVGSLKGTRSTKLNYLSTVREYFAFHGCPLPKLSPSWTRGARTGSPHVERFLDKQTFKNMIEACRDDPRTRSMLLVQFQSFSTLRALLQVGNNMGLKIAGPLRKGANLVPLRFQHAGGGGWISYIGKDACDALRDWFSFGGWPGPQSPYIWPTIPTPYTTNRRPLTEGAVHDAYARLSIRLGLRPQRTSGKGTRVRYGVGSTQVRNLAVASAIVGGADHMIVHALAGHRVDWKARRGRPPDEKSLEQAYRQIEPHLSV